MHFKRLAILLISLVFVISPIVNNYYSYAAINDDILWQPLNSENDLVLAFQYYCKSRDITIEGSVADAVTTATTGTFNGLCNKLGIDITALQADLKKSTDELGNISFLFDSNGITAYNRIFAQFLQDNELEVGDSVPQNDPKILYSGIYFIDADNTGYMVLVQDHTASSETNSILYEGSDYKGISYSYTEDLMMSTYTSNGVPSSSTDYSLIQTVPCHLTTSQTYNINFYYKKMLTTPASVVLQQTSSGGVRYATYNYQNPKLMYNSSRIVISKRDNDTSLYLTRILKGYDGNLQFNNLAQISNVPNENKQDTTVIFYTNNTINNNTYEGDTIINNYGTPSDPNQPDNPDDPDQPSDPSGGTPPNWNIGGGDGTLTDPNGNTWNINFPDFELPDLNIDWSINGLGNKFPFSIPFDLVALVTVLNAEPQAPRFQGTVNFGFTTWDYDVNLQPFDTVASVCRIAELLLLVFGLIMVTRSIIKG